MRKEWQRQKHTYIQEGVFMYVYMCVYMCVCVSWLATHILPKFMPHLHGRIVKMSKRRAYHRNNKKIIKSKIKTRKAVNYGRTKATNPFKEAFR